MAAFGVELRATGATSSSALDDAGTSAPTMVVVACAGGGGVAEEGSGGEGIVGMTGSVRAHGPSRAQRPLWRLK